jgi:prepilin-type N-terminal cleavage/methylation domain-containing protein
MHCPPSAMSNRRPSAMRAGFTLVEMLVALAIFVILATLTLGAYRGVNKNDQVSAGAQQVKGWFENARSKALRDKQPRGIRFLADMTSATGSSPRLCTSIVYIGGAGFEDGDLSPAGNLEKKFAWVQPMTLGSYPAGTIISPGGMAFNRPPASGVLPNGIGYAAYVAWQAAIDSGALSTASAQTHGLRIEIPRNSGNWYPIRAVGETGLGDLNRSEDTSSPNPPGNPLPVPGLPTGRPDPVLVLAKPVANPEQYANRPIDYRLELGPTVLADKPNPLPRGIVIDLDSSLIPWRPTSFGGGYPPLMDVMFAPNGTFTGQIAAGQGILHLVVSTLEDANAARLEFPTPPAIPHPENATSTPVVYPFLLADSKTSQKVVSAFLTSGRVASSDLFMFMSGDPAADGVNNTRLGNPSATPPYSDATRAFGYALHGKESK